MLHNDLGPDESLLPQADQPNTQVAASDTKESLASSSTPAKAENIAERVASKSRWTAFSSWSWSHWLSEVVCSVLSLACLLGIIAVLRSFEGQQVPTWRYGITLNTIVSILASTATFSLLVPLASSISQAKWLWYRKRRLLEDFELIEEAARGPVGSAWLLARRRGGRFACCGAVLVILILAINPFVQQIVKTEMRTIPRPGATLPVASEYDPSGLDDVNMKAAFMNGILTTSNASTQFDVDSACTTGNCTWDAYKSLAFCGSCVEVTDHLRYTTETQNPYGTNQTVEYVIANLTNGIYLNTTEGFNQGRFAMNVNNSWQYPTLAKSIAFAGRNDTILNAFVIVRNYTWLEKPLAPYDIRSPYAAECSLRWCLAECTATMQEGAFHESMTREPIDLERSYSRNFTVGNETYFISYNPTKFLQEYMSAQVQAVEHEIYADADIFSPTDRWSNAISQSMYIHLNQTASHSLDQMFANVAKSMTRALRMQEGSSWARDKVTSLVTGNTMHFEVHVIVVWAWIALPFALFVLVVALAITVAVSARHEGIPPWKGSSLATLFHGLRLSDTSSEEMHRLMEGYEMEEAASKMWTRLDVRNQYLEHD